MSFKSSTKCSLSSIKSAEMCVMRRLDTYLLHTFAKKAFTPSVEVVGHEQQ